MDQYRHFLVEDFLQDEFFIDWVKNPGPANERVWEEWLMLHPHMEPIVQQARTVLESFGHADQAMPHDFYEQLKLRIDHTIQTGRRKSRIRQLVFAGAAAAVLGIVMLGAFYYRGMKTGYITESSQYAETRTLMLPDHSEIVLNAHSSVRYKNNWNDRGDREIWLSGEAFFRIKHIEPEKGYPRKFIVHAGHVDVQVLGTQFNVAHSGSGTAVLLTSGSVKCVSGTAKEEQRIIRPNDLYSYTSQGDISVRQVNPASYTAWMDHRYIFDRTSLRGICDYLQQYFGVDIVIEDAGVARQQLSGTLELGNEETLIRTLSALLRVPVKRVDRKIIIYSR